MAEQLVDVDLDALAPQPKKVRLAGKVWKLPGDMPLALYFQLQGFQQRIDDGLDETALLAEMRDELLKLLQEHQPNLKELPGKIGLQSLIAALPAIYGGSDAVPPPNRAARRSKKRTPSKPASTRARAATSR